MKKSKALYHRHRFPARVISCAVRWYFRFQLSLRDIEELLFERGMTVTYETIRCWCDKFGAGSAHPVKAARRTPGGTWHLDEMFVTLRGMPLLWRGVDEHGADSISCCKSGVTKPPLNASSSACCARTRCRTRSSPITLRSYPVAKAEIPELADVKHVFVKAAARLNNRTENSHQPTRERERRTRGFCDPNTHRYFSRASDRFGNISH
jgi:putative transposase